MPPEKQFNPANSYNFSLTIKDTDYSQDLYGVDIVTTAAGAYQIIMLEVHIAPKDMILNKVFGQDPIKLIVRGTGNDNIVKEEIEYELMFIKSDYKIPITESFLGNEKIGAQPDKTPVSILTIVRPSYRIMYSLVNKVYGFDFKAKTIKEVLNDLVSDLPRDLNAELDLNENGLNATKISQLVLPPNTFYNSIKYLDRVFGLFYGPAFIYCKGSKVIVQNLTSSIKKPEIFTVFHLAFGREKDDTVERIENVQDGSQYYTWENVSILEDSNSKWNKLGNTIKHVIKPGNELYSIIEYDLDEFTKKYGVVDKTNITYPDSAVDRTKYYTRHGGYGDTDHFAVSMLSKQIFDLAKIKLTLQRSLRILPLMEIGKSVMFKSKTQEYVDITGKYILYASNISFKRSSSGWQCDTDIELVRTSRTR